MWALQPQTSQMTQPREGALGIVGIESQETVGGKPFQALPNTPWVSFAAHVAGVLMLSVSPEVFLSNAEGVTSRGLEGPLAGTLKSCNIENCDPALPQAQCLRQMVLPSRTLRPAPNKGDECTYCEHVLCCVRTLP